MKGFSEIGDLSTQKESRTFETDQSRIVSDFGTILARQNVLSICHCGFDQSRNESDLENIVEYHY